MGCIHLRLASYGLLPALRGTIFLSLSYPWGWLQDLERTAAFAHSLEMHLTPMFKDHKRIFGFGFKSLIGIALVFLKILKRKNNFKAQYCQYSTVCPE